MLRFRRPIPPPLAAAASLAATGPSSSSPFFSSPHSAKQPSEVCALIGCAASHNTIACALHQQRRSASSTSNNAGGGGRGGGGGGGDRQSSSSSSRFIKRDGPPPPPPQSRSQPQHREERRNPLRKRRSGGDGGDEGYEYVVGSHKPSVSAYDVRRAGAASSSSSTGGQAGHRDRQHNDGRRNRSLGEEEGKADDTNVSASNSYESFLRALEGGDDAKGRRGRDGGGVGNNYRDTARGYENARGEAERDGRRRHHPHHGGRESGSGGGGCINRGDYEEKRGHSRGDETVTVHSDVAGEGKETGHTISSGKNSPPRPLATSLASDPYPPPPSSADDDAKGGDGNAPAPPSSSSSHHQNHNRPALPSAAPSLSSTTIPRVKTLWYTTHLTFPASDALYHLQQATEMAVLMGPVSSDANTTACINSGAVGCAAGGGETVAATSASPNDFSVFADGPFRALLDTAFPRSNDSSRGGGDSAASATMTAGERWDELLASKAVSSHFRPALMAAAAAASHTNRPADADTTAPASSSRAEQVIGEKRRCVRVLSAADALGPQAMGRLVTDTARATVTVDPSAATAADASAALTAPYVLPSASGQSNSPFSSSSSHPPQWTVFDSDLTPMSILMAETLVHHKIVSAGGLLVAAEDGAADSGPSAVHHHQQQQQQRERKLEAIDVSAVTGGVFNSAFANTNYHDNAWYSMPVEHYHNKKRNSQQSGADGVVGAAGDAANDDASLPLADRIVAGGMHRRRRLAITVRDEGLWEASVAAKAKDRVREGAAAAEAKPQEEEEGKGTERPSSAAPHRLLLRHLAAYSGGAPSNTLRTGLRLPQCDGNVLGRDAAAIHLASSVGINDEAMRRLPNIRRLQLDVVPRPAAKEVEGSASDAGVTGEGKGARGGDGNSDRNADSTKTKKGGGYSLDRALRDLPRAFVEDTRPPYDPLSPFSDPSSLSSPIIMARTGGSLCFTASSASEPSYSSSYSSAFSASLGTQKQQQQQKEAPPPLHLVSVDDGPLGAWLTGPKAAGWSLFGTRLLDPVASTDLAEYAECHNFRTAAGTVDASPAAQQRPQGGESQGAIAAAAAEETSASASASATYPSPRLAFSSQRYRDDNAQSNSNGHGFGTAGLHNGLNAPLTETAVYSEKREAGGDGVDKARGERQRSGGLITSKSDGADSIARGSLGSEWRSRWNAVSERFAVGPFLPPSASAPREPIRLSPAAMVDAAIHQQPLASLAAAASLRYKWHLLHGEPYYAWQLWQQRQQHVDNSGFSGNVNGAAKKSDTMGGGAGGIALASASSPSAAYSYGQCYMHLQGLLQLCANDWCGSSISYERDLTIVSAQRGGDAVLAAMRKVTPLQTVLAVNEGNPSLPTAPARVVTPFAERLPGTNPCASYQQQELQLPASASSPPLQTDGAEGGEARGQQQTEEGNNGNRSRRHGSRTAASQSVLRYPYPFALSTVSLTPLVSPSVVWSLFSESVAAGPSLGSLSGLSSVGTGGGAMGRGFGIVPDLTVVDFPTIASAPTSTAAVSGASSAAAAVPPPHPGAHSPAFRDFTYETLFWDVCATKAKAKQRGGADESDGSVEASAGATAGSGSNANASGGGLFPGHGIAYAFRMASVVPAFAPNAAFASHDPFYGHFAHQSVLFPMFHAFTAVPASLSFLAACVAMPSLSAGGGTEGNPMALPVRNAMPPSANSGGNASSMISDAVRRVPIDFSSLQSPSSEENSSSLLGSSGLPPAAPFSFVSTSGGATVGGGGTSAAPTSIGGFGAAVAGGTASHLWLLEMLRAMGSERAVGALMRRFGVTEGSSLQRPRHKAHHSQLKNGGSGAASSGNANKSPSDFSDSADGGGVVRVSPLTKVLAVTDLMKPSDTNKINANANVDGYDANADANVDGYDANANANVDGYDANTDTDANVDDGGYLSYGRFVATKDVGALYDALLERHAAGPAAAAAANLYSIDVGVAEEGEGQSNSSDSGKIILSALAPLTTERIASNVWCFGLHPLTFTRRIWPFMAALAKSAVPPTTTANVGESEGNNGASFAASPPSPFSFAYAVPLRALADVCLFSHEHGAERGEALMALYLQAMGGEIALARSSSQSVASTATAAVSSPTIDGWRANVGELTSLHPVTSIRIGGGRGRGAVVHFTTDVPLPHASIE